METAEDGHVLYMSAVVADDHSKECEIIVDRYSCRMFRHRHHFKLSQITWQLLMSMLLHYFTFQSGTHVV